MNKAKRFLLKWMLKLIDETIKDVEEFKPVRKSTMRKMRICKALLRFV